MRCRNQKVPASGFRVPGSFIVLFGAVVLLAALANAVLIAGAGPAQSGSTAKPAAPAQAPAQPPKGYVGSEACATCHTGYDSSINATKHGFTSNPNTPMAKLGCESCHGPGEAHMNDPEKVKPKQLTKISAKEVNATCTTCHNKGQHALWNGSQHEARNVS